jgi:AraC-like DNA-binding protein
MVRASRLFFRYLASYLVLVLLPLTVFGVFLFRYVSDLLVDQAIGGAETSLEVLQSGVDRELQVISDTALKLASSQRLRPFRLADSPSSAYFAVRALGEFRLPSSVVENIVLYYHHDEYLISSSTTVGLDRLDVIASDSETDDAEQVIETVLDKGDERAVRGPFTANLFGGGGGAYLIARFPVPPWGSRSYATASFFISVAKLFALVPTSLAEGTVTYYLESPDRAVLVSSRTESAAVLRAWARGNPAETITDAILISRTSGRSAWHVHAVIDRSVITAPADRLRRIAFVVLATTSMGSFIVIAVLFRLNYLPVRSLLDVLSSTRSGHPRIETLRDAQSSLSRLIHRERNLEARMTRRLESTREGVVAQILAGTPIVKLDLEGLWIGSDNAEKVPTYVVLVVRAPNRCPSGSAVVEASATCIERKARGLEALAERPIHLAGLLRPGAGSDPTVVLLRIAGAGDVGEVAEQTAAAILKSLSTKWGPNGAIGVGTFVDSIDGIPASHDRARQALDQQFILGTDRVLLYSRSSGGSTWTAIPLEVDPAVLRQGTISGRLGEVEQYLRGIGKQLLVAGAPAHYARGLCLEIGRVVVAIAREVGHDRGQPFGELSGNSDVARYATYDEFVDDILRLMKQVGERHRAQHDRGAFRLLTKLRQAIDEDYADPEFSIQELARRFQISPSMVSSLFRHHEGRGANDYLASRRLAEAQRLLSTTDIPLKDLAGRVGYYNVSSFIRRFRRLTGETPGEYRNRCASG